MSAIGALLAIQIGVRASQPAVVHEFEQRRR